MSVDSIIDPQPPDSALVVAGLIPMALVLIILKAAYMKLKHIGDVLDVSMLQHGAVVASATGVGTGEEGGRGSFGGGATSSPGGEGRGNALEERLLQLPSQERKSDSEGSSGVGLFSSLFRGKPGKNPFESGSVATAAGNRTSPNKGGAANSSNGGSRTLRIPVEDHPIDSLSSRKSESEQQEANVRDLNQVTHLWLKPSPISGSEDDDKSFRNITQQHGVGGVGMSGGSTNLGVGTTLSLYPTSAEGGFDPLISRRIPLLGGGDANDRGEGASPATTSSTSNRHHHHDNSDRLLDVPMRRYTSSLLPRREEEGTTEDNNIIREEGQDQQQQSSRSILQGYNPLGPLTFGRNPLGGGGMQQQQQQAAVVTSPPQQHDRNAPPKRGVSATGYSNRQRSTSPKFNPYL